MQLVFLHPLKQLGNSINLQLGNCQKLAGGGGVGILNLGSKIR